MTTALDLLTALVATLLACVLPGWPLARRISPEAALLGAVVLSLTAIFSGCLVLSFTGLRISFLGLAPFQVSLFAVGVWLHIRRPILVAATTSGEFLPRWILATAASIGIVLFVRAWIQPLPGYDTCFRWERLAHEIFSTGNIDYYPARTAADYAKYFYPDSVPPLISFTYAEIYSLLHRIAPEATAWFIALQAVLLATIAFQLARIWGGACAASAAVLAVCACPLLFWCVLMGQESGLTALSVGATILWLERSAESGRTSASVLAGLATGLGAASREYGGAFAIVGLVAAFGLRLGARRVLLYLAAAALVAAPWYLRVWHMTGNPFYPLRVGSLFPFSAVHETMFDELRAQFAWQVLPNRERLRVGYQLLQLAPLALVGGVAGLWLLRLRAPWLIAGVIVSVALWLYGMGVVAGGTYISLRMLSPVFVLLAAAAGVVVAKFAKPDRALAGAGVIVACVSPNFLTMPLMAKSLPMKDWFAAFTPPPANTTITPGERVILDLPGKILSDDPYVHSWIANRGAGEKVVPVWSADVAFLFDDSLGADEQLTRLIALDIRTVVLWPGLPVSKPLLRRAWAQRVLNTWPEIAPGYHHVTKSRHP